MGPPRVGKSVLSTEMEHASKPNYQQMIMSYLNDENPQPQMDSKAMAIMIKGPTVDFASDHSGANTPLRGV